MDVRDSFDKQALYSLIIQTFFFHLLESNLETLADINDKPVILLLVSFTAAERER